MEIIKGQSITCTERICGGDEVWDNKNTHDDEDNNNNYAMKNRR